MDLQKVYDIIWNDKSKYVPKLPLKTSKESTFDSVKFKLEQMSDADSRDLRQSLVGIWMYQINKKELGIKQ